MVTTSRLHSEFACHCIRAFGLEREREMEAKKQWNKIKKKKLSHKCYAHYHHLHVYKREYVVCTPTRQLVQLISKYWRKKEITFTLHAWRVLFIFLPVSLSPLKFSKYENFEGIRVVESKCFEIGSRTFSRACAHRAHTMIFINYLSKLSINKFFAMEIRYGWMAA